MMHTSWADLRRLMPRIDVETFCSELVGGRDRPGLVVDLSPEGARLERPYLGGPTPREIVLELEVPEIDEVIWARGEVCFDQVRQAPAGQGGPLGLLRTTGIRLVSAAMRDLRMLRECVIETHRARQRAERVDDVLFDAACYARG
ncbi:MAG: PilZ domain-containing protein [Myxococcales bacterium]|nr:PilZ domain-containing protein [Myxococcales bacterium]MBK7195291.1 PilZ domain-containing protein [Myxococcales bacterium]MBP6845456.1 PilZ domain-containing protein [Kofleriaceae bacterium]